MKLIKNEKDYEQALSRVEEMIGLDPPEGTDEAEELELLALLINTYEDKVYSIDLPDHIDAIKSRMDFIGSKGL